MRTAAARGSCGFACRGPCSGSYDAQSLRAFVSPLWCAFVQTVHVRRLDSLHDENWHSKEQSTCCSNVSMFVDQCWFQYCTAKMSNPGCQTQSGLAKSTVIQQMCLVPSSVCERRTTVVPANDNSDGRETSIYRTCNVLILTGYTL